ncbi:type III polyketide synthase [Streptomyces sp. H51]|uniref:type III polyketide synthase n=1 Tax=Streptomyces sp. H51 TaxID=3111770 RepID=UPI002D7727E4|nr:3-oxoacyl-[acyl-carrier-protein] synthase III C-terminal domain-containing protein [Streptomyces sp. H51]
MTITIGDGFTSSETATGMAGRIPAHDPIGGALPPAPLTTVGVIESIATGSPDRNFEQAEVAERVAALFSEPAQRRRIPRLYRRTRITSRHLAIDPLDPDFLKFSKEVGTIRDRMNLFYRHAVPLAVDVAGRAVASLDDPASDIGMLVFVTSTGFIAPGVDVALIKQLGLSPTVNRVVVNFMGCAAAMNGMRTAVDYVRAHPDKKALVVCLELSSVNAVFDDDVNDVITHSLFGDGCGAVVIGAGQVHQPLAPGKVVIRDTFSHLFDGAEDGIVLGVNHNGITCELSQNLPQYIYQGVDPVVSAVLERNGLAKSDVDLWAIHPGGPRIIEESARSLGIPEERAASSWDLLARHGNMLSVSLVFVLEQMISQAEPDQQISTGVAFSFAPGVTLEGIVFDIVRQ